MNGKAEVHKDSYPRDYLTDVIRYFEQNHKMIKYFLNELQVQTEIKVLIAKTVNDFNWS